MGKQSLFKTEQNTAENIIYSYLERNYSTMYQEWASANEKAEVYELGFNVQSIELIIRHWANRIAKK